MDARGPRHHSPAAVAIVGAAGVLVVISIVVAAGQTQIFPPSSSSSICSARQNFLHFVSSSGVSLVVRGRWDNPLLLSAAKPPLLCCCGHCWCSRRPRPSPSSLWWLQGSSLPLLLLFALPNQISSTWLGSSTSFFFLLPLFFLLLLLGFYLNLLILVFIFVRVTVDLLARAADLLMFITLVNW